MKLDILYFAWAREKIGTDRESHETNATTVAELMSELAEKSPRHAAVFAEAGALRCAVNQTLSTPETPLTDAREVAFFPPMTGG